MYMNRSLSEIHLVYTSDLSSGRDKESKSEIKRLLWRRRRSVGIAPYILKLGTTFSLVLSYTHQPLNPSSKSPVDHRPGGCLGPLQKKRELPSRSRSQTAVAQLLGCHIKFTAGKQPLGRYMSMPRCRHSNPGDSWLWNCTANSSLRQMEVEAIGRRNLIFP